MPPVIPFDLSARSLRRVVLASVLVFGATAAAAVVPDFETSIRPLLRRFCVECHSTEKKKGELDLERFVDFGAVKQEPAVWQNVAEQLASNEMPPKEKPQPSAEERRVLLNWTAATLDAIAAEHAGDPGPVVMRRLSNAEFTYTIRDLTGVDTLDPVREFPADSAAGEGFMNVGQSLVMSPAMVSKYLDAAKEIAAHAVLLPDGIRFSAKTTRRDWTEELLAEIRAFYGMYTAGGVATANNLQGVKFETQDGGVAPLERYFEALLARRSGSGPGPASAQPVLSSKYLAILQEALDGSRPSFLLDPLRAQWRAAKPGEGARLASEVVRLQRMLWRFNPVGHIGKAGGPKSWMEAAPPLRAAQEFRVKLSPPTNSEIVRLYLAATDAADGSAGDVVVWSKPRLIARGKPDLYLRDLDAVTESLKARRARVIATAKNCLAAAGEASRASQPVNPKQLARKYRVDPRDLAAWLDYLGIGSGSPVPIDGLLTNRLDRVSGQTSVRGWGDANTPNVVANSSDEVVRIPGAMQPRSLAVHPSPTLAAVAAWQSPVTASVRVEASVQRAHPECGNGVTWCLEFRRGTMRRRLAQGIAGNASKVVAPPIERLQVFPGDRLTMAIGPRDGNHACDLTRVDLTLSSTETPALKWHMGAEVAALIHRGNPIGDQLGHSNVWYFFTEIDSFQSTNAPLPEKSLLAQWLGAADVKMQSALARQIQALFETGGIAGSDSPDDRMLRQALSLGGPLLAGAPDLADLKVLRPEQTADTRRRPRARDTRNIPDSKTKSGDQLGVAPLASALFGVAPRQTPGAVVDPVSLVVCAPQTLEAVIPAGLAEGREFVVDGYLHPDAGREGSAQLQVTLVNPLDASRGLVSTAPVAAQGKGTWTDGTGPFVHLTPILVNDSSSARRRIEADFAEFSALFPAAMCYTRIVPVDEVVTLTLFHREDSHFARLMLEPSEERRLDRLWDELRFVSQDALTLVDAFEQLWQYATQDADPKVFEPMREPFQQRAAAFRHALAESEPAHVHAIAEFANKAYRRTLADSERTSLHNLYAQLLEQGLVHEEAIRFLLARVLVSPAFLYRSEKPGPGQNSAPISDWELASRLSYFLWASTPDPELMSAAASGTLHDPAVLGTQAKRLLKDSRIRRLATEFGCAWLHVHGFDQLDEKSERHFPTFDSVRPAMYEETIQFFTDWFQNNGRITDILAADYTFLNETLAKHYGVNGVSGPEWRRIDGARKLNRGGILAQGSTLAKHSGASRTSPILRGNWVAEVLLGEKLPRPPKDVPQLPEDEITDALSVRQLTEKHSSDPKCAGCHRRIDPYGFALEGFDAIGRIRDRDLGGKPIDTKARTLEGTEVDGLDGLRHYLLGKRWDAFLNQFCRKLLGYALAREVLLSDRPLIAEMKRQIAASDGRVGAAIKAIIGSRQFREIRGMEAASNP